MLTTLLAFLAKAMNARTAVLTIDLRVEAEAWTEALSGLETEVSRALDAAAQHIGLSGAVDVLLASDDEVQVLNARWREKDAPTDVLSFPADPEDSPPGMQRFLGDLVLGFGVVTRDAAHLDRSLDLHLAHLLVHGFLHLAGYDHISPADAKVMEGLEAEILAPLGLPDPYGDKA